MERLRNLFSGKIYIETKSIPVLREVILYGMYSNWFISFFDKLSFPGSPHAIGDQQWVLIASIVIMLFFMFFLRGRKRIGIGIIHGVFLFIVFWLEVQYRYYFSFEAAVLPLAQKLGKFILFSFFGFMIWGLIIFTERMIIDSSKMRSEIDLGVAKLSKRNQATIPVEVRTKYGFIPGDHLIWKEIEGHLILEKK